MFVSPCIGKSSCDTFIACGLVERAPQALRCSEFVTKSRKKK
jgi:hypothetical protein